MTRAPLGCVCAGPQGNAIPSKCDPLQARRRRELHVSTAIDLVGLRSAQPVHNTTPQNDGTPEKPRSHGGGAGNRTRVRKCRCHLRLRAYPAVYLVLDCAGRRARSRTIHLFDLALVPVTRTSASQFNDGLPEALAGSWFDRLYDCCLGSESNCVIVRNCVSREVFTWFHETHGTQQSGQHLRRSRSPPIGERLDQPMSATPLTQGPTSSAQSPSRASSSGTKWATSSGFLRNMSKPAASAASRHASSAYALSATAGVARFAARARTLRIRS